MNDAQSTVVGLKAQDCPGGGWTGMPADMEQPTVADCLAHGVCGCIYGDAVQHIERLRAMLVSIGILNASGGRPDPEIDRIIRKYAHEQTSRPKDGGQ